MPRKLAKGYFVRGQFVVLGSAQDLELKAQLRGGDAPSKTQRKRDSAELQQLGEALLSLPENRVAALGLDTSLLDALAAARKITNFEGRRRQGQLIGKLMRTLSPEQQQTVRAAVDEFRGGSAQQTLALHQAEQWREQMLSADEAVSRWAALYAGTDLQRLRTLVRQARKDASPGAPGAAPRQSRAYREVFQIIKEELARESNPA